MYWGICAPLNSVLIYNDSILIFQQKGGGAIHRPTTLNRSLGQSVRPAIEFECFLFLD